MFPGAVEAEPMAMGGSCSEAPAGTDQLDLEAAEQLIQLSGGDNGAAADADADAGSESRSADSVKCRRKDKEKGKEAAVESRRRRSAASARIIPAAGKDDDAGNGAGAGEPDIKGVDTSAACSATAADDVVEKEEEKAAVVVESCPRTAAAAAERCPARRKDRDGGGVAHGEARKRPRYRLLADIYRDGTEPTRRTAGGGQGHADRDPPEGEKRKKEKKRAPDGGVVAVDAKASKARRSVQLLAHTRM